MMHQHASLALSENGMISANVLLLRLMPMTSHATGQCSASYDTCGQSN